MTTIAKPQLNVIGGLVALAIALLVMLLPVHVSAVAICFIGLSVTIVISPTVAVALMLVFAPLRTLVATEAALPLPLDVGQITFIGVIAVWLSLILVKKHRIQHQISPLYVALGGFLLATGLTVITASSIGSWFAEWLKWGVVAVLAFIVSTLFIGKKWKLLVLVLIFSATGHAIVGLYTFLGGSGALHLAINDRFFRAFGTFGQPNPFGGFMGLIAPVALMIALGYAHKTWDTYYKNQHIAWLPLTMTAVVGLCALLITAALFASWSRGAWLGFILSVGVMICAIPRRLSHSIAVLVACVTLGGLLWFSGQLPTSITDRIGSATQEIFTLTDVRGVDITPENYPIVERLGHWQASLNMARANPWLGVGFGNFDAVYDNYRLINWNISLGHAHNYYLNVLAETGIIGFAAYAVLFLTIYWMTWQARLNPDRMTRYAVIGLLGTWTYLLAHSLTDNLYVNNIFIHIGVLLGLLTLFHQQLSGRTKATIQ